MTDSDSSNNKKDYPKVYPDRFHPEYLGFLRDRLQVEDLAKNAVQKFQTLPNGEYKTDNKGNKIPETKKCVRIDFCGLSSNTLLGKQEGNRKGNTLLVGEIESAFEKLFNKQTLDELYNEHNCYLKIRFCFSYVYADVIPCLIYASNPDNWKRIMSNEYNFKCSQPIKESDLIKSDIYKSQIRALETLTSYLDRAHRDGHSLTMHKEEKHSIQIRFSVVPSTLCALVINNIALCDSYLYACLGEAKGLKERHQIPNDISLFYPITIVHQKNDDDIIDDIQFKSIHDHFKYLWKHEATLFCGDGTKFTEKDWAGLSDITPPKKIEWNDKERRILKYKAREMKISEPEAKIILQNEIDTWRAALKVKIKLCTSKVIPNDVILHLGKQRIPITNKMILCSIIFLVAVSIPVILFAIPGVIKFESIYVVLAVIYYGINIFAYLNSILKNSPSPHH